MSEVWLPVVGYEGLYEVSQHGNVRSLDRVIKNWKSSTGFCFRRGADMKLKTNDGGYLGVSLCKAGVEKSFVVHRLVAEAFHGVSSLPQVNHKDLDKKNNFWLNLEWVSHQGNMDHAIAAGLHHAKTNSKKIRKVTPEVALEIQRQREEGKTQRVIALSLKIDRRQVQKVLSKEHWTTAP